MDGNALVASAQAEISMSERSNLQAMGSMSYSDQGIAFLNSFWTDFGKSAEAVYIFAATFTKISPNGEGLTKEQAFDLIESLESSEHQMTAIWRSLALDNTSRLSLIQWLLTRFGRTEDELLSSLQGGIPKLRSRVEALAVQVEKYTQLRESILHLDDEKNTSELEKLAKSGVFTEVVESMTKANNELRKTKTRMENGGYSMGKGTDWWEERSHRDQSMKTFIDNDSDDESDGSDILPPPSGSSRLPGTEDHRVDSTDSDEGSFIEENIN